MDRYVPVDRAFFKHGSKLPPCSRVGSGGGVLNLPVLSADQVFIKLSQPHHVAERIGGPSPENFRNPVLQQTFSALCRTGKHNHLPGAIIPGAQGTQTNCQPMTKIKPLIARQKLPDKFDKKLRL